MNTPIMTPAQTIAALRERVTSGGQLTREEVREALSALRQNNLAASVNGKKPAKAPARPTSELLAALKGTNVGG